MSSPTPTQGWNDLAQFFTPPLQRPQRAEDGRSIPPRLPQTSFPCVGRNQEMQPRGHLMFHAPLHPLSPPPRSRGTYGLTGASSRPCPTQCRYPAMNQLTPGPIPWPSSEEDSDSDPPDVPNPFRQSVPITQREDNDLFNAQGGDYKWPALSQVDIAFFGPH
ncbi:uncharacterized protein ARMOST_19047 [Armillaria ostoyae]|uniref:Uncharacterized protein n=1 Tax=Armillaria ostoyae TaxID=47428 RepID=A0A284S3I8_ARMOS|nr:uncharacterized protein ARMOST_19047 [Armillaria ostoyae]